jgi:hypothetical protein
MGWLFSDRWATRADLVKHLRRPERFGENRELLRATTIGNNHWYLVRIKDTGRVWIGLDLMQGGGRHNPGWGYKDLDESVGPCECNCPLAYIKAASPVEAGVGYAHDFRERVRRYHAKMASKRAPEPGLVIKSGDHEYRLDSPAGPCRGWIVSRVGDGARFRMPAAQLSRALLAST